MQKKIRESIWAKAFLSMLALLVVFLLVPLIVLFYGSILAGQLIFRRKLKAAQELENE